MAWLKFAGNEISLFTLRIVYSQNFAVEPTPV